MRETIGEWKSEWIGTNGKTDELEVLIHDSKLDDFHSCVYEGSFAKIPEILEKKKVIDWGKILASSIQDRTGAYSLTI